MIIEELHYKLSLQHKRALKLIVIFKIYLDFVLYILYIFILQENGDRQKGAPYILFHCVFL